MSEDKSNTEDSNGISGMSISRRGALAGLAGLGLISAADPASAGNGNHLGESWQGTPGGGTPGLKIVKDDSGFALQGTAGSSTNDGADVGVVGYTDSTKGKGLIGHARSSTGNTRGLQGRVDSSDGTAIYGQVRNSNTGDSKAIRAYSEAQDGEGVVAEMVGGGTTYAIKGTVNSSSGYGLYTPDDAKVDGTLEILGDIEVSGVKNFVQTVSSDAGPKQVKYTSVEAGEPQTEHSDVVEMENGVAVVELPDHFGMVTSDDERLAVQVTPYCDEPVQPQVTDKSTDRIVVEDFGDGREDYAFSYTVKGIRQGFEDQEVVSDR